MNRFWRSFTLSLAAAALLTVTQTRAQSGIAWKSLVHLTATADVLQKDSGCDGCLDAGASSQDEISTGDGYVEFTVGETNTFWMAGLSHSDDDTTFADIDFGFRFNGGGWADILENGAYQSGGDTPYAAGDVFRVALVGGNIRYSRNGTLLLEHQRSPVYPLVLDTSLGSMGATIHHAQVVVTTAPPVSSGGALIEKAGSPALRPRVTRAQIDAFLPPGGARGAFTFPAP